MTRNIFKTEANPSAQNDNSIADPYATVVRTGEQECETACPSHRQPTDAFELAIRLLAHRNWRAAGCPPEVGAKLLPEVEREETAPSGHDQSPFRDRNLSPHPGRTFEEAIRLLAHRKWEAAVCPAGVGVELLLKAAREVTAPSGQDQAPLQDNSTVTLK